MLPTVPVASAAHKPKLLDQVRDVIRRKHYSVRTEQAYIDWIKRFIIYHNKRHPAGMAEEEVAQFLTHLARDLNVAASTQNQHVKASLTCLGRLTSILCSISMCYVLGATTVCISATRTTYVHELGNTLMERASLPLIVGRGSSYITRLT